LTLSGKPAPKGYGALFKGGCFRSWFQAWPLIFAKQLSWLKHGASGNYTGAVRLGLLRPFGDHLKQKLGSNLRQWHDLEGPS